MACFVSKDSSCTARERPYPFHSSISVALLSKNQQPLTIELISEIDKIKAYTKTLQEWNQTAQALAKKASKQKIPECVNIDAPLKLQRI
jgi:hypothetical protein